MKLITSLFCCSLLSTLAWHGATAAPDVKIDVRARVTSLSSTTGHALDGLVTTGDVFTGSYSYDSTVTPLRNSIETSYDFTGDQAHVRLTNGTAVFGSDAANVSAFLTLLSQDPGVAMDAVNLRFHGLPASSGGVTVDHLYVLFMDHSGQVSDPKMPMTVADLQNWPERRILIYGRTGADDFSLELQIESITSQFTPPFEVSPGASRFLPQQRFDAMLLLPAGAPNAVSAQASVNGRPVPLSYPGNCTLAPPNSEGRQAILCPDAHWALTAEPTVTEILWSVELADNTTLLRSVEWQLIR